MASSITAAGLQVDTLASIIATLVAGYQGIYGSDINVDQNSPDGQTIGIYSQVVEDYLEFLVSINNGFDPDQAQGVILDQRCAINNIQRQGGTYTVQPIDVTVSTTVTLQGLDSNYNSPTATAYTVQDSSGNQFILAATTTITAGTHSLDFRAQKIGGVSVPIDTITTPVTIVPGVTTVNNSSAAVSVGQNQETDAQLRTRRAASVANATTGFLNGLQAALLALPGVTEAVVYDNPSGNTINGMVPHSIWAVVAGGAASDIANTIYQKLSAGCNMNGVQTYNITTPAGALFLVQWDNPAPEPLYIQFNIKRTVPGFEFSTTSIATALASSLAYGIGEFAETSSITAAAVAAIIAAGGGGIPVDLKISTDNMTWVDYISPSTLASEFTVAAADISITVL